MRRRHLVWSAVAALSAAASLSGCAVGVPGAATTPTGDDATNTAMPTQNDTPGAAHVHGFPHIVSCDEVGALVAGYVGDIPFDAENSYVQSDAVLCSWAPKADQVDSVTDIQTFSVSVSVGDDEVPDSAAAAAYGMDMYFTDPRLDALGGVGLWIDAGSAAVGGGAGTVLVPGVEITVTDGRFGQSGILDRDGLVTVASEILKL